MTEQTLIERIEAAEVGSRELDGAVWFALFEPDVNHGALHVEQTEEGPREALTCELGSKWADDVGHYTTSIDAAVGLAERVLPGWVITLEIAGSGQAYLYHPDPCGPTIKTLGKTPALALVAAILRAKEGEG
ncbi:MAG TPA: hypothetical protein VGN74_05390 [Brevundimonas sp.]|jgi:hypothetical protein|uniref:hypothetical protein n=1 Tax=Brevundimonas sp. TaxID=1871086 RepID=UPI002E135C8B|nr:hypothetical protein [Brevundimonas sp.]